MENVQNVKDLKDLLEIYNEKLKVKVLIDGKYYNIIDVEYNSDFNGVEIILSKV